MNPHRQRKRFTTKKNTRAHEMLRADARSLVAPSERGLGYIVKRTVLLTPDSALSDPRVSRTLQTSAGARLSSYGVTLVTKAYGKDIARRAHKLPKTLKDSYKDECAKLPTELTGQIGRITVYGAREETLDDRRSYVALILDNELAATLTAEARQLNASLGRTQTIRSSPHLSVFKSLSYDMACSVAGELEQVLLDGEISNSITLGPAEPRPFDL